MVLIATTGPGSASVGTPWAWTLFGAAYLLVAVPFGAVFLARLAGSLADTEAERAVARARRPWVRAVLWMGAAALAVWVLKGVFF
jgi:hypothetical protein